MSTEDILRGLQETMTVMEALERRHAERLKDHQAWLEALNTGWSKHERVMDRHEQAMDRHEQAMDRHEQAMRELDEKLSILATAQLNLSNTVDRFIQSLQPKNGH